MADAQDLGSCGATRGSSSLPSRTNPRLSAGLANDFSNHSNHSNLANSFSGFAPALLAWFSSAKRDLPWRRDYEPYAVWISEILLQQTQMERGVAYFKRWMRRFPDIASVARADEGEVLAMWEGLGYYSRARNLHAAARMIVERHGGVFPAEPEAIRSLPGVGEYTAGAIAAIAFNIPEPAVDANVLRVFARLLDIESPVTAKAVRERVTASLRAITPPDAARAFAQALMELGALVCAKTPVCGGCPVARFCMANRNGTTGERPVKAGKPGYTKLSAVAGVVMRGGRFFISKRPAGGLWGSLWELPNCPLPPGEDAGRTLLRHLDSIGLSAALRSRLPAVRHSYTTHRLTLRCHVCDATGTAGEAATAGVSAWAEPEDLAGYAFPGGMRKILEGLGWK